MIIFADGQRFTIAGTVLSDGTTIIPLAAVTVKSRPDTFPISTEGVTPPIIYVELEIIDIGTVVAAMSMAEYNIIVLKIQARAPVAQPNVVQRFAQTVARKCGSCGQR